MELILSVPSVLVCLSSIYLFFLVLVSVALVRSPSAMHLRCWAFTFWAPAIGGLLIACRSFVPLWVSDYIGCMLFLMGLGCVWMGMRSFQGRMIDVRIPAFVALGFIPPAIWADRSVDTFALWREIYIFFFAAMFFFLAAYEVRKGKMGEVLPSARYAFSAYVSFGLIHVVAIWFAIEWPIEFNGFIPVSNWLFVFTVLSMLHTVAVAFLGVVLAKDRAELKIKRLAYTDELTGLNNRRAFLEGVQGMLSEEQCGGGTFLIIDIDHFKQVNDTYGHQVGDIVLQRFGHFLKSISNNRTICGRIGGEEFGIYLPGLLGPSLDLLAENICKATALLDVRYAGQIIRFTISIGLADTKTTEFRFERLYEDADLALYRAKRLGRNTCCRFDRDLQDPDMEPVMDEIVQLSA
ncbi:GGDEF domain-containing protein [Roseibium algae]|uniref:diguanylate cyclase n=1 Tax=Roseibium algae TaxID=3123038 RepID=A0ABU8TMQ2_9HYPH